ncbi:hypothetical protein C3Y98_00910 [Methylotenera oryzisoli]|uniref:Uncharacterized protein n=1 Tax=Methylotenera oryzisoli TaxID=2080758 RepID=A0A4Y9VTQ9_9PROT|nr:hypothetical protein [Methylotenera oryzisoli]TFW72951.1 hypothetical protein C3Y98_00910 [Methylotenera oryzisoli]
MAILDAIVYVVGEAIAYVVGAVTGRAFHIEPKKAQRIGEYFVMAIVGVFLFALIAVTFIYS